MENSYFSKRHYLRFILLVGWFFVDLTQGTVNDVWTSIVYTNPPQVTYENTTLNLKIQPIQRMEIGAVVELIFPMSGVVKFDPSVYTTTPECQFQGTEVLPDDVTCVIERLEDGREMITWTSSHDPVHEFEPVQFYALKCISNPLSTEITDDFEMRIYSDASKSVLQDQQLIDLYMQPKLIPFEQEFNIFRNQIDGGTSEVGKLTDVEFTLKSNVPLAKTAFITVDMPKLNPTAPRALRRSYINSARNPMTCTAVETVSDRLTCSFSGLNSTHDRLKIEKIFPKGLEERDVVMVIRISNIYNPLSTQNREFFAALAVIGQLDGAIYNIQEGPTIFKAFDATGFSEARVYSLDTTVQEYTEFTIEFRPMIDVDSGAYVSVQFPTSDDPFYEDPGEGDAHFQFDGLLTQCSTRDGLFGASQDVMEFTQDSRNMRIKTLEPTTKYGTTSLAKMVLKKIPNPFYIGTFGPFRITVYDNQLYKIADQYTDIYYTVTTGNILNVQLYLGNYAVQKHSNLRVQFAPLHDLKQNGKIYIEIPLDLTIPCPEVFELNSVQLVQPLQIECDSSESNKFTISNPFALETGYTYSPGLHGYLIIVFRETVGSVSARNISALTIETRTADDKVIDKYVSNSTKLTIVSSPFFAQDIITGSDETFTDCKFTFKLVLADVHPAGSYFKIHIPPEVEVPDSITSESGYTVEILGGSDPSGDDPFILKVSGFDTEMASGETVNLDLSTLQTPKTTVSTSTFKIYSKDQEGRIINFVDSEYMLTMLKGKNIGSAKISTTSTDVGDPDSGLVLDFETPVPIEPTDQIRVMIPDEFLPPANIDGKCEGQNQLADQQSNCQRVDKVVTAKSLAFRDDPNSQRRRLAVPEILQIGSKITFIIRGCRNPQTGMSTKVFKFYILNQYGATLAEQSNEDNQNMMLTMAGASSIEEFSFILTDTRQQAPTAAKISWRSTMPYPTGAFITINYREDQIGAQDKSAVRCSSNLQLEVDINLDTSNIMVLTGMVTDPIVEGTYIQLVISGLFNKPLEPVNADSWLMTVLTPKIDGNAYHIDQIGKAGNKYYDKAFQKIDINGDDRIDLSEFTQALALLEIWIGMTISDAETMFTQIKTGGGDFVLFDEFLAWSFDMKLNLGGGTNIYESSFKKININGDRKVDVDEFTQAIELIESWGLAISDPVAEFNSLDKNGDGIILLDEFISWSFEKNLNLGGGTNIYDNFFKKIDIDGDGTVDVDEMTLSLPLIELWIGPIGNPETEFNSLVSNGDGIIEFDKFFTWSFEKNQKNLLPPDLPSGGQGGSLEFEWLCTFPCETCSSSDPTQCFTCNFLSGQTINYEKKCYESCPEETYYRAVGHTCSLCDPNCLTCDEINGKICLSCDPDSYWPFLDGTTCKSVCPYGSYGDVDEGMCKFCKEPCHSCQNGPYDCNTCDRNSSANAYLMSKTYEQTSTYFMDGDCKAECDEGYTVPIGNEDLVCLKCSSNCKTCVNDLDYCTTCNEEGENLLSMYDNKCYSECPKDVTVRLTNQLFCITCSPNCNTCEDNPNKCTSCKKNSYLWENKCEKDCTLLENSDGLAMTLISQDYDWTCRECQYPCKTCQTKTDYCLTCQAGWVQFEYRCVRQCPEKYTDVEGICVLTGFFCPFGYKMENGNRCILDARVCVGTDTLNYDQTKCVPHPDMFFPCPLLIPIIIFTAIITYSKLKRFPNTRWIATMISMLAFFESIGLVCMVILGNRYGIAPAFTLSFLALLFLVGLNLFCTLIYCFQMKPDSAFKYWEEEYEDSTFFIVLAGFLINFKIHRMFYSRWWGKRDFEAAFSDEIMFYRSVMFSSCVYIMTCIVPVIIATIFVINYIPFGYQLQMFGLEMFMIEVSILILLLIELYKIRKHFLQKAYYKVKSDEMGEGLQFNAVPDSYRQPSQNAAVLEKAINRIEAYHAQFRMEKRERVQTIKEIQELREEEYGLNKVRRCVSFADLREERLERDQLHLMLEEDSDQERNVWENFISEPSSPTATWYPKEGNTKETLRNPYFNGRMQQLAKVYGTRGQFDNCYAESKPSDLYQQKSDVVQKQKSVQANVLELLGVDDFLPDKSISQNKQSQNLIEINQQIAEEEQEGESIDADMFSKGLVDNVVGNFEGYQDKQKRRTLAPSRVKQLPEFEIHDIQGKLEIDEDGNFIIINEGVDENGIAILEDLDHLRVNQRGYLIDESGNIVFRDGTVVFRADEIDQDGEIPAPYCFMKKETLGMNQDMFGDSGLQNAATIIPEQEDEEMAIDEEYKMLKGQRIQKNLRYEQDNNDNDQNIENSMRSDELDNSEAALAPSKQIKRLVQNQPILYNMNDEDFITQVSKPMRPESKKVLVPRAQKPPKSPKRSAVSVISKQKSYTIRADNDAHTSIDADFLINGNIGMVEQTSFYNINDKFDKQDIDMDINENDINVPMGVRPKSSVTIINKKRGISSKTRTKILRPDQQALLLENTDENYKRDKEQEILDGIEKFQAMLKRYPLKARQTTSSRTLTLQGKQLNKVYGKIKTQYTKQIKNQDEQQQSTGALQLISYAQHRQGYKDGQCYLKNCSIHGNNSFSGGSTSKIHPHGPKRMKGLSTIYQQDLRNRARTGYTGGVSTFSLQSNRRVIRNAQSGSIAMPGDQSMQPVGSHLTRIMAINQDPSTYVAMDAGSFQEANSEQHLDEMRATREYNEMRYLMEANQDGSFTNEERVRQSGDYQINSRGLAQSFSGNRQKGNNFIGFVDERPSSNQFASNSSDANAEMNALLKNNSSSSAYMRGALGKANTNLLEGAYL